jgi:hypothetical protein
MARPTLLAPGMLDLARMLSFWRWVSVSRLTVCWEPASEPPQAATVKTRSVSPSDFMILTTSPG